MYVGISAPVSLGVRVMSRVMSAAAFAAKCNSVPSKRDDKKVRPAVAAKRKQPRRHLGTSESWSCCVMMRCTAGFLESDREW